MSIPEKRKNYPLICEEASPLLFSFTKIPSSFSSADHKLLKAQKNLKSKDIFSKREIF